MAANLEIGSRFSIFKLAKEEYADEKKDKIFHKEADRDLSDGFNGFCCGGAVPRNPGKSDC